MMNHKKRILGAAALLGIFSLLSRLAGVIREHLLARYFGALSGSGIFNLDTYYAAFRLPDLVFNLLVLGTVSAAFVPIFSEYLEKKDLKEGWNYTNSLFNLLFLMMLGVLLMLFFFAPLLVKFLAPGFESADELQTVSLTRIMLLSPLIFCVSSIAQSIQNAFHRFFFYGLAPVMYNLGIIVGIVFFAQQYGVYGVAFGVILGALLHLLVQLPVIWRLGFRYRLLFDYKRKDVRETLRLMGPRVLGMSAMQIMLIVDTVIASTMVTGSIAILNYAVNLQSLPMGVVGVSFSVAVFGVLSGYAISKSWREFSETLQSTVQSVLMLVIPASFGIFLMRYEIVSLILGAGKFTFQDVLMTSSMLGIYMFGLFAQTLIPILARTFYAMRNTAIPLKISLIAMICNVFFSLLLVFIFDFGIYGLAISNVTAAIINLLFLGTHLTKKLRRGFFDVKDMLCIFSASIFMSALVLALKAFYVMKLGRPEIFWEFLAEVSIITAVASAFYFFFLRSLRAIFCLPKQL